MIIIFFLALFVAVDGLQLEMGPYMVAVLALVVVTEKWSEIILKACVLVY